MPTKSIKVFPQNLKMVIIVISFLYGKMMNKDNIFVLAPLQKGALGVEHLNLMLQDALNTNTIFITHKGKKFKVNDKVMQIQNNYDKDVYNGDIGTILLLMNVK